MTFNVLINEAHDREGLCPTLFSFLRYYAVVNPVFEIVRMRSIIRIILKATLFRDEIAIHLNFGICQCFLSFFTQSSVWYIAFVA